jgi:hypothetical protein
MTARKGLATIATLLAGFNLSLLVVLALNPDRVTIAPQRVLAVVAATLPALLTMAGMFAAIDLWKARPRGRVTGTALFGLMAFSAALKWVVEGAPNPLLRGSFIALWICLATMTAIRQDEAWGSK